MDSQHKDNIVSLVPLQETLETSPKKVTSAQDFRHAFFHEGSGPSFQLAATSSALPQDYFKKARCSCGQSLTLVREHKRDNYPFAVNCPNCQKTVDILKHRQRLYRRHRIQLKTKFIPTKSNRQEELSGLILDFSPRGARAFVNFKMDSEESFRLINDTFSAQAQVMWLEKRSSLFDNYPYEVGLRFSSFRSLKSSILINRQI